MVPIVTAHSWNDEGSPNYSPRKIITDEQIADLFISVQRGNELSVSVSFQDLIISTLKANPKISALVADRVYDGPPEKPTFPYISMGPDSFSTEDADCIDMREQTVQIDCWTRKNGRKWQCKEIVDAIVSALRHLDGDLTDGALIDSRIVLARVLDDPDGITAHGIVQVTAIIEDE